MGRARHPKPYKKGKSQITIPWKRRVLAKLAQNKLAKKQPANLEQLKDSVGATKGALNSTFDLEKDPPQLTSAYATDITEMLGIEPPLIEADDDSEDLLRDIKVLRSLTDEARGEMMATARRLPKRR
jgi:hypothetical protein